MKIHISFLNDKNFKNLYNKYGIYLVLLLIIFLSSFVAPNFLTHINIMNLLTQIAVVTIIACGITLLIIEGETDLSAGSVVALCGCLCVDIFRKLTSSGFHPILAGIITVLLAMAIGMACNLASGAIIVHYKAPAFIVTLAMMQVARGIVFVYTQGQPIYNIGVISEIGQGKLFNFLPYSILVMLLVTLFSFVLLKKTRFGRYIYAVGGNKEAAIASGIRVNAVVLKTYLIHGILVGLAGVLYMTRLNSGQPAEGVALEFDAITAAVIGGTSFTGGIGTIPGTIAGSIIIGVIKNVLNLMRVQSYYQQIITGCIIVLAVIIDIRTKGGKNK